MRKIHKTQSHKSNHGFTLLEMVVVIAIILIVMPMIVASFILVIRSHQGVTYLNDAKDLASLTSLVIDNRLINANEIIISNDTGVASGYKVLHFNNGDVLVNGVPAFDYPHFTNEGIRKWNIVVTFSAAPAASSVRYKVDIVENSSGDVYYTLESSAYLPNTDPSSFTGASSGTTIKFKYP